MVGRMEMKQQGFKPLGCEALFCILKPRARRLRQQELVWSDQGKSPQAPPSQRGGHDAALIASRLTHTCFPGIPCRTMEKC